LRVCGTASSVRCGLASLLCCGCGCGFAEPWSDRTRAPGTPWRLALCLSNSRGGRLCALWTMTSLCCCFRLSLAACAGTALASVQHATRTKRHTQHTTDLVVLLVLLQHLLPRLGTRLRWQRAQRRERLLLSVRPRHRADDSRGLQTTTRSLRGLLDSRSSWSLAICGARSGGETRGAILMGSYPTRPSSQPLAGG
jgi:hypothetical protein